MYGFTLLLLALGAYSEDELFTPVLYPDLAGEIINVPVEEMQQDAGV